MKNCLKVLVAGFIFAISCVTVAMADCQGQVQHHNQGHFVFETHSWSEDDTGPGEISFTCIVNRDPNRNDLPANWHIPGPSGYFPYEEQTPFPRRTSEATKPLWGCLEYGSVGKMVKAEFLGDSKENREAGSDAGEKCGIFASLITPNSADSDTGFPPPQEGWVDRFRLFFPSSIERAQDTLLKFEAYLQVNANGDGSFTHTFKYEVARYDDRKEGKPSSVFMEVRAPEDEKQLFATLSEEVDSTNLDDNAGAFDFTVKAAEKFRFAPMLLTFKERGERTVAHLQVSVLTPAQ